MTEISQRPRSFLPGLVPTLNHRGFMPETLDRFSVAFVHDAGSSSAPVLDIGCAYGVASRAALDQGATVHACDMDAGHVAILSRECRRAGFVVEESGFTGRGQDLAGRQHAGVIARKAG